MNPYKIQIPTIHECLLYYHSITILRSANLEKKCPLKTVYDLDTFTGVACQYVHNSFSSFATKCSYELISDMFAPYVFYDEQLPSFMVIKKLSHCFTSLTQQTYFRFLLTKNGNNDTS